MPRNGKEGFMKLLEFMRRDAGLSQRALGEKCVPKVNASYICCAEKRGLVLGAGMSRRLADALGHGGDPMDLFKDVTVKDVTVL